LRRTGFKLRLHLVHLRNRFRHPLILRGKPVLRWFGKHAPSPAFLALLLQLAGAFAVLYGVSYWSIPCALIVGGIGAIAAMEMQGRNGEESKETPEEEQKIKAQIDAALARGVNPFTQQAVPLSSKWLTYVALVRRTRDSQ
jgi:hypothetical protein